MLKIENYEVVGWEHAIRGARNPMNSWEKSDSNMCGYTLQNAEIAPGVTSLEWRQCKPYIDIGENDHDLLMRLRNAGTDHRKFMRMIVVYADIVAMQPWWSEFDTYKIGSVRNSCSKMHKIHVKEFTMDDFEHQGIDECGDFTVYVLKTIIMHCNYLREKFNETQEKKYWRALIELLPEGYMMRATVMLNYEVLANIYKSRRNHKLSEWHVLCDWIEKLPYSELIIGEKNESNQ